MDAFLIVGSTYESAPLLLNLERRKAGEGAAAADSAQQHCQPSSSAWRLTSRWCNLGLWPASADEAARTSFKEACASLAAAVGEAASLGAHDEVLDVGVGYAEQTNFWIERFGVRRVVAVEASLTHVEAAHRAQRDGSLGGSGAVDVIHGSATALAAAVGSSEPSFDVVLCLDCAYHFSTRAVFLRDHAAPLLRPEGRFAAADLIVATDDEDDDDDDDDDKQQQQQQQQLWWWWRRGEHTGRRGRLGRYRRGWRRLWRAVLRRLIARLCDIPWSNLHGAKEYAAVLETA